MKTQTMSPSKLLGNANAKTAVFRWNGTKYTGIRAKSRTRDGTVTKFEISRIEGDKFGALEAVQTIIKDDEWLDVENPGYAT